MFCPKYLVKKPKEKHSPAGHWQNLQSIVAIRLLKRVFTVARND